MRKGDVLLGNEEHIRRRLLAPFDGIFSAHGGVKAKRGCD